MPEDSNHPKFRRDRQGKINHIIKVFFDLVKEKGYKKVSTNLVAKEAGVSIGTIYRYFPEGKPAIIREQFNEISENFIDYSDVIKIITKNDIEAITRFIKKYLTSHRDSHTLHEAFELAQIESREIFSMNGDNLKNYIKLFLTKAKDSYPILSKIPVKDAQLAFMAGIDLIDHSVHQHLFYAPIFASDEELIDYLVELFQMTLNRFIFKNMQIN